MGAKKLLLLLLLLFLATVLLPAEGDRRGQGAVRGTREHGVKLCGREFIRAVVFICGGSRWKRSSSASRPGRRQQQQQQQQQQHALPPGPRAEFAQMNNDTELENTKLHSVLELELEQLRSISQSTGQLALNDLFNLYDDYEFIPTFDNLSEYIHQLENVAHKKGGGPLVKYESNSIGSNDFPWIRHHRRKRNFSLGMAGMCCKWGCTKTEMSVLC